MSLHKRRNNPPAFTNYHRYKQWLRDEFFYRCTYCQIHEAENQSHHHFGVEHFKPKSLFPILSNKYSNLLYACSDCNSKKSDTWPNRIERLLGFKFLNPCEDDLDIHIDRSDVVWEAKTKPGLYQIEQLGLNFNLPVSTRKTRRILTEMREKLRKKVEQLKSKARRNSMSSAIVGELRILNLEIGALDNRIDVPALDYPAQLR